MKHGFHRITKDAHQKIASKGGRAAHAKGTAHEFTTEEAVTAGRKGGRVVSKNRAHMAEIGRKGAATRAAQRKAARLAEIEDNRASYVQAIARSETA
jgi:general stress protein YciG